MPEQKQQDIMNEGPGLRQRARETNAVLDTVAPKTSAFEKVVHPVTSPVDKVNKKPAPYGSHPGETRLNLKDMDKAIGVPSYKDGTDYVPKTGPAILHKGEKVVPKEENDIVLGARQFPNPKGIKPRLDTDKLPVRATPGVNKIQNAEAEPETRQPPTPYKQIGGNRGLDLRTFHKGTPYVDKTGPAILEKGEAVVPKEKNMANPYDMITKGDKKPPKKIKTITHKKAHDGKIIHTHVHHHPEHHPDETHVSNNMDEMMDHMKANAPNMSAEPPVAGSEATPEAGAQGESQAPPQAPPQA